ncbi:relaxase/mobilization nuclease domain-containing protein [Lachnotalea sp. AF33-28]|uniref:relaxase/mobilization nuclease domain-containing protein n=1 Tax=Lachnotalea sp. AF33-28 TaxID=2292046 RepID=UPI000E49BCB1|nr:relaxase/mobilization nuclease domain-containing protein [Lachnotalea sp. AF33-28]RHP31995.1 relaxase [Lachnotalea sp. AF33-28]
MAILKHISSKNADYGDAEKYLIFEHDEFTMKPTLDADGRLIPRADYRISSLNCDGEDFAVACMRANLRYEKNQKREDVKSHHYIISFDPRDGPDNGLTVDRAQELGEKFCAEHFPGHQALVCTHPDGHNHTENIHVHIVINSLRIAEVPMLPHMDRPADRRAGCKHRCTDAAMNYLKAEVMEMCHSERLYQIDLLNGSKERVTDREYWAQKKGQAALDERNAPMIADSITPRTTKFETDKAKLRRTIRAALSEATSFDEFSSLLLREGVTVKESRGRLSYLTPDRTKPITARKLGDDFDRIAVLSTLEQNAARTAEKAAAIPEYPASIKERLQRTKPAKNAPKNDAAREREAVQRMVDIAAKKAEGKGRGYEKWATMHNLKQMAATLAAYQQYGFSSPEELDEALTAAHADMQESLAGLKALEASIADKKELQRNLLSYIGTKPARDGLKAQKSEKARKAYREQHQSDFILAESATRYFKAHGITKLPVSKALQREIEQLTVQKNAGYNDYREKRERVRQLQTVKGNIDQILRREPSQQKKQEQER